MKTVMKKNKFRSYDQYQLKHLSDLVCDDIENLLHTLEITEYKVFDKMVTMSCPIHGGDNSSAFNLYHQGDSYRGNWKCRTHQCENIFKSSILGFIRGCLSKAQGWNKDGDPMVSFNEAISFAIDFTKHDPNTNSISKKTKEKHNFVNTVKHISSDTATKNNTPTIPRQVVLKSLQIPSQYFLNRGFSKDILIKYDVGDCYDTSKEMSNRAVVPVYDNNITGMVGCTGRSVFDRCDQCKSFHSTDEGCPDNNNIWKHSKWKHNKNFKTQDYLYNYWFAEKYILDTKTVIVVESPGNVWRLEEAGIHNAVAMFGSSLHQKQKMLLDTSGAMNIITIMDNDSAGKEAALQIENKCGRIYNIKHITPLYNDIAEMTAQEVIDHIIPQINESN